MRLARAALLLLAYVLVVLSGVVALGAFRSHEFPLAGLGLVAAVAAFWLVLKGEAALDEQALDEFEG